jgi:tetratricopeptide (TPR) repeat protein
VSEQASDKPYVTAQLSELTNERGWAAIRRELGVQAFGINAWTAREAGEAVIVAHDEEPSGHEELYLVLAGRATFIVGRERIAATAGTIVFVRDPAQRREALAEEPGTTVLAVGGKIGEAYRPRAWEINADVLPLFDSGQYAKARVLLTAALEAYDDRAIVHYNLACAEAQLGETDAALQHLAAALRERPSFAADAHLDADLEPIRSDPRFDALVPEI